MINRRIEDYDLASLRNFSVDIVVDSFVGFLKQLMHDHIPHSIKNMRKSTLQWLNQKCKEAIAKKHATEGSMHYQDICNDCAQILYQEKAKYLEGMKKKMQQLPKGSKRWWSLNKQLLNRQAAPSFFPPLKNGKGD